VRTDTALYGEARSALARESRRLRMSDANQSVRFQCPNCETPFSIEAQWKKQPYVAFCPFCSYGIFGEHIVPAIVTLAPKARALSDADIEAIYQRFAAAELSFTVRQHDGRAADWE
jgi:hypothetical protein